MTAELQESRFHSTVLSDQILTLQRTLNCAECRVREAKADVIKLNIQLQDVKAQRGIFTGTKN